MLSTNIKVKVQHFGRFLSNMVMPNMGAFIAWGLITALFIPTGWLPNATIAKLVSPMITYLLPLLIGYTGGRLMGGERGGVVGAITTIGVIIGASIPMLMGAMIAGPLGGWAIKHADHWVKNRVKSGFEMLVNNFSAGIIGMLLALLAFLAIGPLVGSLSHILSAGVNLMIQHNLLPFTAIFVEPAKILFLNNAINHGIFSPLGIQQATETGKSIFFLIEANPGPGLGVLLAYMLFGRGSAKQSAPGAMIIHVLGGIHEIYFPYVLMNPRLMLAVILGGITGIFTLTLFNVGLVSPASPGSIVAILLMTPKSDLIGVMLSVLSATLISFMVAALILKRVPVGTEEDDQLASAAHRSQVMKKASHSPQQSDPQASPVMQIDSNDLRQIRNIFVACDAGMGSSAMGASVLHKKVQDAGLLHLTVAHCAINELPIEADMVITHQDLTQRAVHYAPQAQHISLKNFLDSQFYTDLVTRLLAARHSRAANDSHLISQTLVAANDDTYAADQPAPQLVELSADNIFLNLATTHKEQAIRFAGEQLVSLGYVTEEYIHAMLERETLHSTYLGQSIAVPHGTIAAKDQVIRTGIVICQYPQGIQFDSDPTDIAHLVIGIAARNNEHIQVISRLTNALDDEETLQRLLTTSSVPEVLALLSREWAA